MKTKEIVIAVLLATGLVTFFLLLPRPAPVAQAADDTFPTHLLFEGVRLFDGERLHESMDVLVEGETIAAIAPHLAPPSGTKVVDGRGKTLLPGLIDAHTHTWGDALERALHFGVTTEIDMFTDAASAAEVRAQQKRGEAHGRADLVSAGTLVTAPGGHGTEYGIAIPTLDDPAGADAFVADRLAEGSDFIKIVYGEAGGHWPTLDAATLGAVITAAHEREALAVVHVSNREAARTALDLGADGLVHIWSDRPPDDEILALAAKHGAFVIPTLSVIAMMAGQPNLTALDEDPALAAYITPAEAGTLTQTIAGLPLRAERLEVARQATVALAEAGVPILAGTDAPNPGTAHGASLHGELSLLVEAGLTPTAALAAATSVPARAFGLDDRGRVASGLRADLVLVDGDPTQDIRRTRHIVGIWKAGRAVERRRGDADLADRASAPDVAVFARFDDGELDAAYGHGWQSTTDGMMGGQSTVTLELVSPGAAGSVGALSLRGSIRAGFPFPWAGGMIFPGAEPMTPVDFSSKQEVVFLARGDGASYRLMLFAESLGQIPASASFTAGEVWAEHRISLRDLAKDLRGVWGLAFAAGPSQGDFELMIDQVSIQ
ncbi:MAG: CIA30 family protein [Deltaproteobacteria bacterium]|nr:CIA30 family protein [Deltaproteobacteria bacterium]